MAFARGAGPAWRPKRTTNPRSSLLEILMFTQSHRSQLRACCRVAGVLVLLGLGLNAHADSGLSLDRVDLP